METWQCRFGRGNRDTEAPELYEGEVHGQSIRPSCSPPPVNKASTLKKIINIYMKPTHIESVGRF